jgi:hypothetical protein
MRLANLTYFFVVAMCILYNFFLIEITKTREKRELRRLFMFKRRDYYYLKSRKVFHFYLTGLLFHSANTQQQKKQHMESSRHKQKMS